MARTAKSVREQRSNFASSGGKGVKKFPKEEKKKKKKRKYRYRPGTKALKEIRKFQKSTELLIPKIPFLRLVREIAVDFKEGVRFTEEAVKCLQVEISLYKSQKVSKIALSQFHCTF